jgi:UDP-N-acetylglucosamine 1-carboxyvinyltransferase
MTVTAVPSQHILNPQLEIAGSRRLSGELRVSGAKNSALVLMAASLLTEDQLRLRNVPPLTDIQGMGEILSSLGVKVRRNGESLEMHGSGLNQSSPPYELVNSLRASFFCIGPLLARLGIARVPLPGGCQIGTRPVVEHVKGLKALGAQVTIEHGVVSAVVPGRGHRLKGGRIHLDCPSVGATETLMMAAALAEGETVIENAALEPEVVDLAGLLLAMGAKVRGAGTPTITIVGVERLHGADYAVIPDRIEAGTFLLAAAITRSMLTVGPVITDHLGAVLTKLEEAGCKLSIDGTLVTIRAEEIRAVDLRTQPFPGFPKTSSRTGFSTWPSSSAWAQRSGCRAAPPSSKASPASAAHRYRAATCGPQPPWCWPALRRKASPRCRAWNTSIAATPISRASSTASAPRSAASAEG